MFISLFFWREGCDIIPCLTHLDPFSSLIILVTLYLFPFFLAGVSQILREQPITFVLCLYFVLYPLYHPYHACTEVSSCQRRECLDPDNINVCAVSLGLNR